MPDASRDQLGLLGRELDDNIAGIRGIANVNSERAVEDVVDLEVRWDLERALAQMLRFHEPLDREHAKPFRQSCRSADA
jgi:hypothetical protein